MYKLLAVFALIVSTLSCPLFCRSQEKEHIVPATCMYKTIDVARHNAAIRALKAGSEQQRQQTITAIINSPNDYNPPVIYALSGALFKEGKKDEAAYWFYLGQLRARYDANLCLDVSARQAVAVLNNEYGLDINKYTFKNIDLLDATVNAVVAFVKQNDENYDHRWIALHGMSAMISGMGDKDEAKEVIEPTAKWPAIKKKTIEDYYNGFLEAKKSIKK